ncbi:MAG: TonB-dependent receptor [Acidobacteriota bacterium]|nr:TonB-dependent receptor [Acidobacteriota bacterium]
MFGTNSNLMRGKTSRFSWFLLAWALLGIILAIPAPEQAQVLFGSLVGSVHDPSGAAIPNAKVTVVQKQTQLTRSTVTDSSGRYTVATLPAGSYDVKIEAKGFQTFLRTALPVAINTVERVDATLQLGEVTQTVQVTAAAALLQTDRGDVRHTLNSEAIENVPLAPGNNFEHLFQAIPGFNPPTSAHSVPTNPSRALQFNVNGASSYGNDVRLDGVSQFNIWVPENAAYIPSSDAIQVVNVVTNSFSPEQGLAGGSSINVQIKSGTNQLHGDVYEFHYDNALEGLPYFAPNQGITRVPKDIFNQFGGSVGGPIKKNKLFYFANIEATRQRQFATTTATVPTLAMRRGDLRGLDLEKRNPDVVYDPATGSSDGSGRTQIACNGEANVICTGRISPVALKLLALLPAPNIKNESTNVPSSNFLGATDVSFNRLTTDEKVTWNATDKLHMFGDVGVLWYNTYNPQIFGAVGGPQVSGFIGNEGRAFGHTVSISLNGSYILAPNFVVDANFGMTRMVTNAEQLDLNKKEGTDVLGLPGVNGSRPFEGSWPQFNISSFSVLGTQHNFMPYFRNDPQFHESANASWIKGNHNIRFGMDLLTLHLNQQQPEWNAGGSSMPAAGGFDFGSGPTACNGCVKKGHTTSTNAYNDFATFLLGLDTAWGKNIQVPDYFHTITHEYGLYVGDQWQATSKLTADLGLRWEYYPMPTRGGSRGLERYDFVKNEMKICGLGGIPTDCGVSVGKHYFMPRIGLAYRAMPTLVVRAGAGITYDPYNLVDDLRTNYPILIPLFENPPTSLTATGVMDSASLRNSPAGQCAAYPDSCIGGALPIGVVLPPNPNLSSGEIPIPGNVNLVTTGPNVIRGYIESWNFTVEKELPGNWVAQAGYVASRTVNQVGILDLNVGDPTYCVTSKGKTSCGGAASEPYRRMFGRTAGTSLVTPIMNDHYDSLQATVQHRFAAGYQIQLAYTLSKTIGTAGVENEKNSPRIKTPKFAYLNRGLAPIDLPQNFEAVFVAQPPFGAGRRWATTGIASKILGGWQVSGLGSLLSGYPVTMSASGTSLNASGNDQRPDILLSKVPILGAIGPEQDWFYPGAFQGVDTQRFGTSPFYVFHGPSAFNLDLGLFRTFKLTERFNLQFRAQAFNSTNTPHFNGPSGSCGSLGTNGGCTGGSFGQVTSTRNFAREGIDQRQFEFGARLSF